MGFDLEQVPLKISEYFEYRKKTQPLKSFNCGCIFKNPSNLSAGALIDELGLKGFEYKGLRVSTIHANFIENVGAANFDDFKELIKLIQETVYKAKGFYLELEIQNT
jgi:UDP-N-acetylmuramate dehydrogenase